MPRVSVLVLAALTLVSAGCGAATSQPAASKNGVAVVSTSSSASRGELAAILGVLRRPQTALDRNPGALRIAQIGPPLGRRMTFARSAERLAATLPGGYNIYLLPVQGTFGFSPSGGTRASEGVAVAMAFSTGQPRGGACCETAASILQGRPGPGLISLVSSGRSLIVSVVPDGVARVQLLFASRGHPGGHGYLAPLAMTVPVQGNVVAALIPRDPPDTIAVRTTWYAQDGHVLKQLRASQTQTATTTTTTTTVAGTSR